MLKIRLPQKLVKNILTSGLVFLMAFSFMNSFSGFDLFSDWQVAAIDPVQDLQNQIDETQRLLEMSLNATAPLESEVEKLSQRMENAQNTIYNLQEQQEQKQAEIAEKELALADHYQVFSQRVDHQYRQARVQSPLLVLINTWQAQQGQQALKYTLTLAKRDQQIMDGITGNIVQLQKDKKEAATQEKSLLSLQNQLNEQKAFFEQEIAGAKAYQATLQTKIADLSARQKEILAAKTGTAQTSVGEVPLVGDPNARIDFNPGFSPAFAAFSFGAPHFKGMSQYGALGRAKDGQDYQEILRAYYGDVEIRTVNMPGSIEAIGVGTIPFEDRYLKGIAEMPAQWADEGGYEALKAQAVAARTYALSYVGWRIASQSVQKGICTTEACQVYLDSKYNAGGRWHDAVNDTSGQVVVSKNTGEIFATWYASTSGGHQLSYTSLGHSTPAFWDTTSNWTNWADGAYEKESPWFFKGWYKSRSGDSCDRSHPWLTEREMADILNAWVVRRKGSTGDSERVTPLGSCWSGNPFSLDEMRSKAASLGEEYTSVGSVRVEHSQAGYTTKVIMQTNRGEINIEGEEFKEVFNLRAPGRIAIKSKLFSLEKK